MYRVIALFRNCKDSDVKPYYHVKNYKNRKSAENFLKKQINHPKFYFEIIEKAE